MCWSGGSQSSNRDICSQNRPDNAQAHCPTPAALQIFERDWVLMNWALKYYDDNGDILLQPHEAEAAADQFRRIADSNRDGRVTPEEYRSARTLIMAR